MTMELVRTEPQTTAEWKSPVSGLWVASRDGGFLGMIERLEGRFAATDSLARDIGTFDDFADAQDSVMTAKTSNTATDRGSLVARLTVIVSAAVAVLLACAMVLPQ